jgi:hypothetical protein
MPTIIEPEGPPETGQGAAALWRTLAWCGGLAVAWAALTAAVAMGLRALLFPT